MDRGLREAIRADFGTFHRMAFRELNHGKKLSEEPYLDVLRHFIASSEKIRGDRALVNLPPRHLKSFTISVCFPMWLLGRNPSTRIMLVGNSEALVKDHARQALALMGTSFYHESFPETRLPKGHGTVMNFGTTAGGQIRAVPVNGTITGFGAEFIIADDLCHLTDAARPDHLSATNEFLSNILQWRLNDPERGNMIVVEHRIDRDDVSGQMLRRGGCRHLKLPLIATEPATYPTANGVWNREVGELLRPSAWSQAKIDAARESCVRPDFETVFQQNPANGAEAITKECFPLVTVLPPSTAPVVISVDCAQTDSSRSSYSVALVWCPHEDHNVLLVSVASLHLVKG